jgi:hypothetical protein
MSLETLNILNDHLTDLFALSPFSETFTYSGGTFTGIFDHSHIENTEDREANVTQKKRYPRIMTSTLPLGLTEDEQITRENGDIYKFKRDGKDDQNAVLLWLY